MLCVKIIIYSRSLIVHEIWTKVYSLCDFFLFVFLKNFHKGDFQGAEKYIFFGFDQLGP